MTTTETGSYCPYDLTLDPAQLSLVDQRLPTRFGQLRVVRSPRVSSERCTLFMHGVGATWAQWTPLLTEASRSNYDLGDIVLVDLPGFGQSENTLGHLNIDVVGRELIELVTTLGYSRIRLAGHSMGGFLALDMASRGHAVIESVHLVAGAYFSIIRTVQCPLESIVRSPLVASLYGALNVLAVLGDSAQDAIHRVGRTGLATPFLKPFAAYPQGLKPRVRASLYEELRPASFLLAARNGHGYDPNRQWSQIVVPLDGVFGMQDELVPPADMRKLAAAVPRARLTLVDNAAHLVHIEQPARTLHSLFRVSGDV